MLAIQAYANVDDIIATLTELETTQANYALMVGLNRTVAAGKKEVVRVMPDRFTLRKTWTPRGVRAEFAKKNKLEAFLGTKDWYMADQETGGVRRPSKDPFIFVPSLAVRQGGTFSGLVRGKRGGTLLKAIEKAQGAKKTRRRRKRRGASNKVSKPFVITKANGTKSIVVRKGRKKLPIKALFVMTDTAQIEADWHFEETANFINDRDLRGNFIVALDQGFKTAKGGGIKSSYVSSLAGDLPNLERNIAGVRSGGVMSSFMR